MHTPARMQLVGLLEEFAEAEHAMRNESGAVALRKRAALVRLSINRLLWAKTDGADHYITQLGHSGTREDCVDFTRLQPRFFRHLFE